MALVMLSFFLMRLFALVIPSRIIGEGRQ